MTDEHAPGRPAGHQAAADPVPAALVAHVRATAALLALTLDEARMQRVAANLQRTAALAALLDAVPLAPHDELAEIYCPAPFRGAQGGLEGF